MPLPVLEPLPPLPMIKKKVKKAVPPPPPTQRTCTPPPLPLSPPPTQGRRIIALPSSSTPSGPRNETQHYGKQYRVSPPRPQHPPPASSSASSSLAKLPHRPFDVSQVRCGTHPLPPNPKPAPILPAATAAATAAARAGGTRVACGDAGGGGSSERRLSVEEARSSLEKEVPLRTASPSREDWNGINPFSRNPTSSLPITTLTSFSSSSSSATATQRPQHQRQSSESSDSSSLTALTEESQQLSTPSLRDEAPLPPVAIAGLGSPILLDNAQLPKPTERVKDDKQEQPGAGPSHVDRPPLPSLSTVGLETPSAPLNVQLPTPTSGKPTQQDDDSDDEFDEELPDESPCSSRQRRVSSPPSSRSVSPSPSAASVKKDDAMEEMECEGRGESGRKRCRDEYEAISEEETAQDNERLQALYANSSSDVRRKRHATIKLREALARAEEEQEQAENKYDDVKALMLTHYGFTPADEDEEDGLDVDMEPNCDAKMEEA